MPNEHSSEAALFAVMHRSACKDLEIEKLKLQQTSSKPQSVVINELAQALEQIVNIIRPENSDPEAALRAALSAMDIVEAKRFIFDNLLEGLKRGEKPAKLEQRYRELSLLGATVATTSNAKADPQELAQDIQKSKGILKRVSLTIGQIACNALKAIPKFIEVEPSVIFLGPIPIVSFAIKGKGVAISDLWDILKAPRSNDR